MLTIQDIRHALRVLRSAPTATFVAVLSIAISVGAASVVFAAIKSVLIDPLPYSRPGELVQLRLENGHSAVQPHADWVSWVDMQDVRRLNRSFESLGVYHYAILNLAGDQASPPEALYGLSVSADLFPTLGVSPMLGRNILPEEDQPGRDNEIILSYGLWARRFNSDPRVVGRSVQVNGHECRIIGVMPAGFDFPLRMATPVRTPSAHIEFWAPLGIDPAKINRAGTGFGGIARSAKRRVAGAGPAGPRCNRRHAGQPIPAHQRRPQPARVVSSRPHLGPSSNRLRSADGCHSAVRVDWLRQCR
jgi:hypothetical protein